MLPWQRQTGNVGSLLYRTQPSARQPFRVESWWWMLQLCDDLNATSLPSPPVRCCQLGQRLFPCASVCATEPVHSLSLSSELSHLLSSLSWKPLVSLSVSRQELSYFAPSENELQWPVSVNTQTLHVIVKSECPSPSLVQRWSPC